MSAPVVVDHPLVQHKLTLMRDRDTPVALFRDLAREVARLMAYEALRDLPLEDVEIETPVAPMTGRAIRGRKLVLAPILRAGLGFLDGMLDVAPRARVAHIGLARDPETLQANTYYFKAPEDLGERLTVVIDPMLATGHTAIAAVDHLKSAGAGEIRFVCLVAAPEGVEALAAAHPDVRVFAAAIDETLNDHGYIVPGLGDAGDRIFGTR